MTDILKSEFIKSLFRELVRLFFFLAYLACLFWFSYLLNANLSLEAFLSFKFSLILISLFLISFLIAINLLSESIILTVSFLSLFPFSLFVVFWQKGLEINQLLFAFLPGLIIFWIGLWQALRLKNIFAKFSWLIFYQTVWRYLVISIIVFLLILTYFQYFYQQEALPLGESQFAFFISSVDKIFKSWNIPLDLEQTLQEYLTLQVENKLKAYGQANGIVELLKKRFVKQALEEFNAQFKTTFEGKEKLKEVIYKILANFYQKLEVWQKRLIGVVILLALWGVLQSFAYVFGLFFSYLSWLLFSFLVWVKLIEIKEQSIIKEEPIL